MLIQCFREKFFQEARLEGQQHGLMVILKTKFGTEGLKSLMDRIGKIADPEKLNSIIEVSVRAASPQEVLKFIEEMK